MKYLKYAVISLGVLALIFLLVGMIKPEVSYECEITVEKPLSESWAVAQDEEKMVDWLPGFQKIEHISGTPGKVGAESYVFFDNQGEIMKIKEKITDIIPYESISMTYESDFMNMDYKMTMTSDNGNTKIMSNTVTKGNGIFSRSLMALMGGSIKDQEEMNLSNLKKTIENNTKEYSQSEG